MATDPMYKLEHGVKDQQKSKAVQPTLDQLQVHFNTKQKNALPADSTIITTIVISQFSNRKFNQCGKMTMLQISC